MRLSFGAGLAARRADNDRTTGSTPLPASTPDETRRPPLARLEPEGLPATLSRHERGRSGRTTGCAWFHTRRNSRSNWPVPIPPARSAHAFPLSPLAWVKFGRQAGVTAWDNREVLGWEDGDPWVGLKRVTASCSTPLRPSRGRTTAVRHAARL